MASENTNQGALSSGSFLCDNQNTFCFDDPILHQHYTARQMTLRRERLFTDVLLKSEGLAVPCHKLALASASPYFYSKFSSGAVTDIMELQHVSPDILELIIDYIYTAKVGITPGNVKALLSASVELKLHSLKDGCDQYMADRVEPANAMGLVMLAKSNNLEATKTAAMDCLLKRADDVLRLALNVEFKILDQDTLTEWLSPDELEVPDESVAFRLLERWINADKTSRLNEECISNVLKLVRLGECPALFIVNEISTSPLIQYKDCHQQYEQAMKYAILRLSGENTAQLKGEVSRPRQKSHLVVMGGGTSGGCNTRCWSLKQEQVTWTKLTKLPQEQQKHTFGMKCCVIDDDIVITGGAIDRDGTSLTNKAWLYSVTTNQWKALPSMNRARRDHAMVFVGQQILVFGGRGPRVLSSTEMYDKVQGQWVIRAPMTSGMSNCHAFNIKGKVFVISGAQQGTLQYDVTADTWHKKSGMPTNNSTCSMGNVGDSIFVIGGQANTQSYTYDTICDTWSKLSSPINIHDLGAAVIHGDKILLCGGWDDNNRPTSKVDEYDIRSKTWSESQILLPAELEYHCICVANLRK